LEARVAERALLGQVTGDRFQIRCVDAIVEPASIGCGAPIRKIGVRQLFHHIPGLSRTTEPFLKMVK
jgi:hypothetical protein